MIAEGEQAPQFDLPGVVDGDLERITLAEHLGETVVILAFYPADFNPLCTEESTGLDDFAVFGMQEDATVLGISTDSVYSHRAFATRYDLNIPLLTDIDREVADAYGVPRGGAGYGTQRAVVVIDHGGSVVYTWAAADLDDLPDIEAIQTAFGDIGDADVAESQYRDGCEAFDDGRDAFVEGMQAYERREWVMATSGFDRALAALEDASEAFESAIRFSEDEAHAASFELGLERTVLFRRAVSLFAESTSAHANRESQRAEEIRAEAESVLETVRERGVPPSPEEIPVDIDPDDRSQPTGDGDIDLDISAAEADRTVGEDDTTETVSDELDDDELDALTAEIEGQDDTDE